jgi:histidinol-phosphatase (PHP family)
MRKAKRTIMIDYHTHTGFSYDNIAAAKKIATECRLSEEANPLSRADQDIVCPDESFIGAMADYRLASMYAMVRQAVRVGLTEIAVTDHYDPLFPSEPSELDFESYFAALNWISERFQGAIRIVKGLELGLMSGPALAYCRKAVERYPWDFIIASIHAADGLSIHDDAYRKTHDRESAVLAYYQNMLDCIESFDGFDVLGHLNVIDRYVEKGAPGTGTYILKHPEVSDLIDKILKLLIKKGKGIEINTSSLRLRKHPLPPPEILRRYAKLGGKILTIGSDAHVPIYIGFKLDLAMQCAKKSGLTHIASFSARKPDFIAL